MIATLSLVQDPDSGWWVAEVPELGAVTKGQTKAEAERRAYEAAEALLGHTELILVVEEA